ncbi:MAG TPA: AAA family ATPase [Casimicrobiaceae bacterium]
MQIFFVIPTRQHVGLTSVALGLVRALQHQGLRVGFVKPVAQDDAANDHSLHFARTICQIDAPDALPMAETATRMAAGDEPQLLEDIVSLCMRAAEGADVLVCEGGFNRSMQHTMTA